MLGMEVIIGMWALKGYKETRAEARVASRFSPCGVCGGQSGNGTGFFPSTSVFPCQFNSTDATLLRKMKIPIIFPFIFITTVHSKP
jgi:hypothetical protein